MSSRAPEDKTRSHDWLTQGLAHVWLPYAQMKTAAAPLPVLRTDGCRITLTDGRQLIDGIASWWTACHGYNHPHIRQAVEQQLAIMPHVMFGGLAHEPALSLARRLAALLPGDLDRVFFSESGSVSVEVAMKMAVQFWVNQGQPKRRKFIAFRNGYHGDTTGAMAVCDPEEGMHALFRGLLPEHVIVDLPRDEESTAAFDQALEHHADDIAGIIVEPLVQGAGGMKFHAPGVLQRLRQAADRYDLLLIFDEIFTGIWTHRNHVRLPGSGRRAGHHHAVQGAERWDAAAGSDCGAAKGVRRLLVGRSEKSVDAWPHLYGQPARLRGSQRLA